MLPFSGLCYLLLYSQTALRFWASNIISSIKYLYSAGLIKSLRSSANCIHSVANSNMFSAIAFILPTPSNADGKGNTKEATHNKQQCVAKNPFYCVVYFNLAGLAGGGNTCCMAFSIHTVPHCISCSVILRSKRAVLVAHKIVPSGW